MSTSLMPQLHPFLYITSKLSSSPFHLLLPPLNSTNMKMGYNGKTVPVTYVITKHRGAAFAVLLFFFFFFWFSFSLSESFLTFFFHLFLPLLPTCFTFFLVHQRVSSSYKLFSLALVAASNQLSYGFFFVFSTTLRIGTRLLPLLYIHPSSSSASYPCFLICCLPSLPLPLLAVYLLSCPSAVTFAFVPPGGPTCNELLRL